MATCRVLVGFLSGSCRAPSRLTSGRRPPAPNAQGPHTQTAAVFYAACRDAHLVCQKEGGRLPLAHKANTRRRPPCFMRRAATLTDNELGDVCGRGLVGEGTRTWPAAEISTHRQQNWRGVGVFFFFAVGRAVFCGARVLLVWLCRLFWVGGVSCGAPQGKEKEHPRPPPHTPTRWPLLPGLARSWYAIGSRPQTQTAACCPARNAPHADSRLRLRPPCLCGVPRRAPCMPKGRRRRPRQTGRCRERAGGRSMRLGGGLGFAK